MSEYGLFHDLVYDFNNAAKLVEASISGSQAQHVMSKKAVSHFNLGTALELMLKMALQNRGETFHRTHNLAELYDLLPKDFKSFLEGIYPKNREVNFIAFSSSQECPDFPNLDLSEGFRSFLLYLDKHARLSQKRYVWESMPSGEWEHYLGDISPFTRTVDLVLADYRRMMDNSPTQIVQGRERE